jgi:serine/threonine protein phosphatase 1
MLKHIKFKADDRLCLLGDYIDRGPDSIGTLMLVAELLNQPNVTALLGNHDQMFYRTLYDKKYHKATYFPWDSLCSKVWLNNHGSKTLQQYNKLNRTERDKIYSLLSKINRTGSDVTITLGSQKICLCHAVPKASLSAEYRQTKQEATDFALWSRPVEQFAYHDYQQDPWKKLGIDLVICGHTPTVHYIGIAKPLEYVDDGQRVINIDTYAQDLQKCILSCLRLDDMRWYSTNGDSVEEYSSDSIYRLATDIGDCLL